MDNIQLIFGLITKIITNHYTRIKNIVKNSKNGNLRLNLRTKLIKPMMNDIASYILLGVLASQKFPN